MAAPSSVKLGLPPSAISLRRLFAPASGEHVEALDRAGKSHRGVDVALGKMKAKSAGDQRRADQMQKAERDRRLSIRIFLRELFWVIFPLQNISGSFRGPPRKP